MAVSILTLWAVCLFKENASGAPLGGRYSSWLGKKALVLISMLLLLKHI